MIDVLLNALVPIFAGMALGYVAGWIRDIDNRHVADLNALVMDFALPASLFVATASTARASTSARITMPGPPPAGVSSTERCLSVACARMSTASSVHRPAASALPARLKPSGPGNISGKMVRMVARHMMLDLTDS